MRKSSIILNFLVMSSFNLGMLFMMCLVLFWTTWLRRIDFS